MSDDTEVRLASTVVLLRDTPDGLQTLMLKRNKALGFSRRCAGSGRSGRGQWRRGCGIAYRRREGGAGGVRAVATVGGYGVVESLDNACR